MCSYNRRWTTLLTVIALCGALLAPVSVAAAPTDSAVADRATSDFSFHSFWDWILNVFQPASDDEGDDETRIPLGDLPNANSAEGDGDGDQERGPILDPSGGD